MSKSPASKRPDAGICTETQLATAIDELSEHFVLYDAEDRVVLGNKVWKELNKDIIETTEPGVTFEEHIRAATANGLVPEAVGREEDWLRERLQRHRNPSGPFEMMRQDGTWLLVHEQRLPSNATIFIASDISKQKAVEEELRQSEERFQAFIKNLPAKMHIKDPQGRYIMINPVTESLFGVTNQEAVGKTVRDIFPEQRGEIFDSHDKRVLKTGVSSAAEEEFQLNDGSRTFLTIKFPIRDASGNVAAIGSSGIDISERKQIEQLLRKREQELNSVVESSPDLIIRYDIDCRAVYVNRMVGKTLLSTSHEIIGKRPIDRKDSGFLRGAENYQDKLEQVISTGQPDQVEISLKNPLGEWRVHSIHVVCERNSEGEIIGALAFGRDVTERKQAEEDLRIAAIALDSQEAIVITDRDKRVIKVNQSFSKITGYSAEEAIGHTLAELLRSDYHDESFFQAMQEKLEREKCWAGEIWDRHKDGGIYPHRLNLAAVSNAEGEVTHYVATFNDISQQKKTEEIIHNLAFFDPLTELPNRRLLQDRLEHTLASSARNRRFGAILFMDLDNFKELNDTKGHGVGDLLLVQVARRLQECVREDDTVARLGGDEFVVVLNDLSLDKQQAAVQAEGIAEKIRASINQSVELQGYKYRSSPSIGICQFQGDGISVEELLKRADTAMYQAKQSGRNAIRFFDPATHAAMEARIAIESDLRGAVRNGQLALFYQMQVNRDGAIIGAEALLRWRHPRRGLVSPFDFIPLAEETGLIIPIGNWVLETACMQLKEWGNSADTRDLQLAINVSAQQFHQPDFVEQVCDVLEKSGVDPGKLKFELTESLMLDDVKNSIIKMRVLKEIGIHFSMDDFGTGHSSLAYLTQLPLDQIKIDQSFVRNIGIKNNDAVIVQTIIGMANNLKMDVIAEGVETVAQRDFLLASGCYSFQGYLFGTPVPIAEFETMLRMSENELTCAV